MESPSDTSDQITFVSTPAFLDKSDLNRSTNLVIVIVSKRAISDAVAAFMVDCPICLWVLAFGLSPPA